MNIRKLFLLFAISLPFLSLTSCIGSTIIDGGDPAGSQPLVPWATRTGFFQVSQNGMYLYDAQIKPLTIGVNKPDWCQHYFVRGDGRRGEVYCYYFQGHGDKYTKRTFYFLLPPEPYELDQRIEIEDVEIDAYTAGKWRRFYGDEPYLPVEKGLRALSAFLFLFGLTGILLAPVCFVVWLITLSVSNKQSHS